MYNLKSPVNTINELPLFNNKDYDVRICSNSFLSYVWLGVWFNLTESNYDYFLTLEK
jgi:hypothetical protein